jgi:hypothetical protein
LRGFFQYDTITVIDKGGILMGQTEEISAKILDYLSKHPEAGENTESVAKWWLDLQSVGRSVDEVTLALEDLVEKKLIRKEMITEDSIFFYKLG